MAKELRPGDRFRSAVCSTEVVVVKAPAGEVDLRCGGAPMLGAQDEGADGTALSAAHSSGTLIGKRYTDEGELELLCSKAGDGSLSVGDTELVVKGAKPLPSSD